VSFVTGSTGIDVEAWNREVEAMACVVVSLDPDPRIEETAATDDVQDEPQEALSRPGLAGVIVSQLPTVVLGVVCAVLARAFVTLRWTVARWALERTQTATG
jgi:hypothetical protein